MPGDLFALLSACLDPWTDKNSGETRMAAGRDVTRHVGPNVGPDVKPRRNFFLGGPRAAPWAPKSPQNVARL